MRWPTLLLAFAVASLGMSTSGRAQTNTELTSIPAAADHSPSSLADLEAPVPRFKRQAIQRIALSGGWIGAVENSDLSSAHLEAAIRTGIPLGSFDNILGVSPIFRVDWTDAAEGIDIPSELYETGVELFHRRTLSERWKLLMILRPAVRSDFSTSEKAFRLFGLGLLIWDCIPDRLSLSFGGVYLDRADIPALPAVGLIYTPRPQTRIELQFPRSRILHRLVKHGSASESWLYGSAGIGGNSWAVTRDTGVRDELSLRDVRVMVGAEQIVSGGGGWFIEGGFALNRRIEYERDNTEVPLSDGVVLIGGWAY